MPDDLDNLLRAAMKTLDEQVPSGYFEALPNQTLARLEGSSMQHGSSGTTMKNRDTALVPPPMTASAPQASEQNEREEDSGLHDIRNLAQSTKQRLSKGRVTQNPPLSDQDALAASSGSWKNIALPQPAKMVALPELAELPSKQDVLAAEKAGKKSAKKDLAAAAPAVEAPIASIESRSAFSLPSQQNKRSKGPVLVILGLGVAAAAGGVFYMQMNKNDATSSDKMVASAPSSEIAKAEPTPAAAAPALDQGAAGSAAPVEQAAPAPADAEAKTDEMAIATGAAAEGTDTAVKAETRSKSGKTSKSKKGAGATTTVEVKDDEKDAKPPEKVEPPKKPAGGAKEGGGEGEPSFDALLKEAGVEDKKEAKPKLDKESLSGDDFKKGMASVASKAQACYKGTQGTASVKLTVSPSGAVSKVTVGGQFAGTPEAKCVEAAVKSASFPAWDGGPQSFNYSYMLSD